MVPTTSVLIAQGAPASTPAAVQRPDATVLKSRLVDLEARLREATTHRADLQAYVAASGPSANLPPAVRVQMNRIDQQIRQLDLEILNLQSDIRLTKARIDAATPVATPIPATPTPAPTPVITVPPAPPAVVPPATSVPNFALLGAVLLVLAPLAIAIAWRIARGGRNVVRRAEWIASEERIQRIEDALEGIAQDVGRMSEGQRFLTNVLSEPATPIAVPTRERVRVGGEASD